MSSLDEILSHLQKFGNPRIGVYNNAGLWHCSLSVFITGTGVTMEVCSDYSHPTPLEAARVCAERLDVSIQGIIEKREFLEMKP